MARVSSGRRRRSAIVSVKAVGSLGVSMLVVVWDRWDCTA